MRDKGQAAGQPAFYWLVLLISAVLVAAYLFCGLMIYRYGTLAKEFGWSYFSRASAYYINEVEGAAAGKLATGDRIIAIDGDGRIGVIGPSVKRRMMAPEQRYTIRVERDGSEREFELAVALRRDNRNLNYILTYLLLSLIFFGNALIIGITKPTETVTKLAAGSSLGIAMALLPEALRPLSGLLQGREIPIYYALSLPLPLHMALMFNFYYRFPAGARPARGWTWLNNSLYFVAAILLVIFRLRDFTFVAGAETATRFFYTGRAMMGALDILEQIFYLTCFIAIVAVTARNYRLVREPDQRRRVRWVIYSTAIGIIPLISFHAAAFVLNAVGYRSLLASDKWRALLYLSNMASTVVPITICYAIIKHRLFDINVVIRRGLQYLLAKNMLLVIVWLPVAGLSYAIYQNRARSVQEIFVENTGYIFLCVAAGLSLKYRKPLRLWLDRKFFREAYNQENLLLELIEDIKKLDSMTEISRLVSERLESALHPANSYVFYREDKTLELILGHSSGAQLKKFHIAHNSKLLGLLEGQPRAQQYPFTGWPLEERVWLSDLAITLAVPMLGSDHHLIGLLLLGEKRSEQPYSANDLKLLEAVAGQIAVVYENALLKGHVDKERKIRRQVLARFDEQQINLVKECPRCGACFDATAQFCSNDSTELELSLPVERVVDGKYRLDRLIGKGGMGAVYEARDTRLNRKVAVKILLGNMFGDQEALRRFEREARASAKLNHQNVITIYDYGRLQAEGAYLVMEYVYGTTLRIEINKAGRLKPPVVAQWLEQILEGMKAAHIEGIVHRDLKPENIIIARLDEGGTLVKVLDFGLAKSNIPDTSRDSITSPDIVMGTPGYIAPEQLRGEKADARSDIFALGVMTVEALTGRRPFEAGSYAELVTLMLTEPFHLPGDSPEIARLDAALQKCLAKDPNQRYRSVAEMQQELIPAIRACTTITPAATTSRGLETTGI